MRESGEISAAADPDSLALAILAVLEGGLLLTQITRSTSRLEQGLDSIIDLIASLPDLTVAAGYVSVALPVAAQCGHAVTRPV
jgi:ABC-type Fe3+ transport system permease subunit